MKDFRSYRREEESRGRTEQTEGAQAQSGGIPSDGEAAELARKALAAYNGSSEGTVLAEIVRQAEAMKRAGTLSNDDLDAFYRQFSPMLEGAQQKKFRSVIERLKRI